MLHPNEPVVLVLKKNSRTLTNLLDWLNDNRDSNGKINLPLLLIDDEADNASINTKEDDNPTAINKHIRTLLSMFTSSSYIAVTATPFANIFILPGKNWKRWKTMIFSRLTTYMRWMLQPIILVAMRSSEIMRSLWQFTCDY